MKQKFAIVLPALFLLLELFCIEGIPVLKRTFPLENTEAVFFTLTQNISGTRDFAIGLLCDALTKTFAWYSICAAIIFIVSLILRKRKISFQKSIKTLLGIACLISLVLLGHKVYTQLPIFDYYVAWKNILSEGAPEHSEFYQKEYINPDSVEIKFNEKRNLILIFLESMEYNFQDFANGGNLDKNLIPEITDYIKDEQSFIPGGTQIWGTGWTIADAVAKTCGIPLTFPPSIQAKFEPMKNFLPGAICLTDILNKEGYNIVFSKGANLKFSGTDDFLNTHSVKNSYGLLQYMKHEKVKKDTIYFWGVRDSIHYELAKEHITRLAKENKPWATWLITVDTHTPYGFLDEKCAPKEKFEEKDQYPLVLSCASKMLDDFIQWAKKQPWYDSTTIAVMGDHATMAAPETIGFKEKNMAHYWLNFFINSSKKANGSKRTFTSLDFFPTILESIGAEIPNGALGLGRSLYSPKPTLIERYGIDSLNRALKKRSIEYDYFMYSTKNVQ